MSIKNRPYTGSWEMGTQSVVRYTPDAKVLINGHTELAVCATCGDKTDFNKYITTISCDVSTDPISTASLTLAVPRHEAAVFSHDGNYVLHPGLEVVILMRGYFPVTGYAMKGQEGASDETADTDPAADNADDNVQVYPYYQVFRGVVTEVSHEYSGGFYTASVTCSSILHFWQYLYVATNGSAIGPRPPGEGAGIDLSGHKFTSMSPYGIIYTLMRIGFGAAFGQNWTISQATNIAAVDDSSGKSLYKHAALWWEKRWQESSMRLRMYGQDGSLFNAMEQSYLGMFDMQKTNVSDFIKGFNVETPKGYDYEAEASRQKAARTLGYRGTETTAAALDASGTKLDAMKMQAYTLDLGRVGQVNLFESEYMSKLEIATTVKELCGFEFYQDVDGDVVFKPPFYNLDTSEDEVYCIRDRDLISCSESEREPEATYVKGSGSLLQNFQGILSGEFGTRQGKYADWRLIAQYGWRETSFESHYYSGAKQMFIGCILRLDVVNAEMRTAQITIPMRPELRPGYPVWVEHLDCFFYAKSLSHSFAPGSSAQTTITGTAKRAKWLPPGLPDRSEGPGSQNLPSLDDMRLNAPGDYPPMPLYVFPEDIEGAEEGASGPPRVMGFPNVVMALDSEKLNPLSMPGGLYFTNGQTYFDTALTLGALRRDPENPDLYRLAVDNDPANDIIISETDVTTAFDNYAGAMQMPEGKDDEKAAKAAALAQTSPDSNPEFGKLVVAVGARLKSAVPDAQQLNNYMGLQRNLKNVFAGADSTGEYRYFSSSAPQPEDQSPSTVRIDAETQTVTKDVPGGPVDSAMRGLTTLYQKGDRIGVKAGMPSRGFRVYGFNPPGDEGGEGEALGHVDVTTREIRFITFQRITTRTKVTKAAMRGDGRAALFLSQEAMAVLFEQILMADARKQDVTESAFVRFGGDTSQEQVGYGLIWNACMDLAKALGVFEDPEWSQENGPTQGSPLDVPGDLKDFSNAFLAFSVGRTTRASSETVLKWFYANGDYAGQEAYNVDTSPQNAGETGEDNNYEDIVAQPVQVPGDLSTRQVPLEKNVGAPVGRVDSDNPGLTGMSDPDGVAALATQLGASLAEFLENIQSIWAWPGDPTPEEEAAYSTFIETVTVAYDYEVNNTNGNTEVLTDLYTEKPIHTTVLPVSDNRGYEVYGSMAYGRGMTIQSYKKLLEVGGSPTNTASMLAVERFFAATIAVGGADISLALTAMSVEAKADLAVALETDVGSLEGIITALKAEGDSPSVYVRNTPVTTSSRGQSYTVALSAEELASLTLTDTAICLCKGTSNSHWIQAFTGEFVELHGDDAVNDFLVTEAEKAGYGYTITKQALSGEMMDLSSGNKLAETLQGARNSVNSLGNTLTSARGEIREDFQESLDDIRRSAQGVAAAFNDPLNPDAPQADEEDA